VLFPRDGITKGDIIRYYARIATAMLPHVRQRRLTMQRWPEGIGGAAVFQKNTPDYFPAWIDRVTVPKKGGTVTHVVCNNAATLVYLANQNCLTPHVGLARVDRIENPDQMVIDLDPPGDDFAIVRSVATSLRELLESVGLTPFVKTTGSRGVHVVVPLKRTDTFPRVRSFANCVAEEIVRRRPNEVTTEFLKANRGDRLFLDVNRNGIAQTAVPAYAVRARDGAPVAVPITWEELEDPKVDARTWTIRNAAERVESGVDPWKGMARKAKGLDRAIEQLRACVEEE
jgi:bifunctional non-homologous end joining protein LigD